MAGHSPPTPTDKQGKKKKKRKTCPATPILILEKKKKRGRGGKGCPGEGKKKRREGGGIWLACRLLSFPASPKGRWEKRVEEERGTTLILYLTLGAVGGEDSKKKERKRSDEVCRIIGVQEGGELL